MRLSHSTLSADTDPKCIAGIESNATGLGPVYESFVEGFDLPGLKEAKSLLG